MLRTPTLHSVLAVCLLWNNGAEANSMMRASAADSSRALDGTATVYIACGGETCTNANGDSLPVFKARYDELHEVRCCSDTEINWKKAKKKPDCPWTGSFLPANNNQCSGAVDYLTAIQYCADSDARLCSRDEIDAGCSVGSGCGYDTEFVWTSTPYEEPAPFVASESFSGSHVLVCGDPNSAGNGCKIDGQFYDVHDGTDDEEHEVRCCSDYEITWTKAKQNAGCDVWGASQIPVFESYGNGVCYAAKTHFEAEEICYNAGARLCTAQEVLEGCVQGTGCSYDDDWVWTSTVSYPRPQLTQTNEEKWLVCGDPLSGKCRDESGEKTPLIVRKGTEVHAIRCCSNYELDWNSAVQNESKCPFIWGGTYIPNLGISGSKGQCRVGTYNEAYYYCEEAGARLCTVDELLDGCTQGSGCRYDDEFVWTSSYPPIPNPPRSFGGNGFHTLACGSPSSFGAKGCQSNGQFFPTFRAVDEERHEVLCCSNEEPQVSSAIKNEGCSVWSFSEIPLVPGRTDFLQCIDASTWSEARQICLDQGARLCFAKEVMDGCARGSGCGNDKNWVWTETNACNGDCPSLSHVDKYVGCYQNTRKKVQLPLKLGKQFSVDMCYNYCLRAGYAYFGMHNGDTCFCGDDKDTTKEVDEGQCNKQCLYGPGTCGGPKANSLFATGLEPTGEYNFEDKYLGCFVDDEDIFAEQFIIDGSIRSCIESCTDSNYALARLSGYGACSCGNQKPKTRSNGCNNECGAGRGLCGAFPMYRPDSFIGESFDGSREVSSVYKTKNKKPAISSLFQCTGAKASWWGDPHFITFDKLSYNCQGLGHFIVTQCDDWELQGLFKSRPGSRASVTDGIAAKYKDYPVVQVNIAHFESELTTTINECPVHVFVDGQLVDQTQTMSDVIDIHPVSNGFEIQFPEQGPALRVKVRFGRNCLLDVDECVPESCMDSTVGMLGTPNGNKDDEWMTRDGTTIFPRPADYKNSGGYDYCTTEWCVQTEEASLFTYGGDKGFDDWDECAADYPGDIVIEDVDPEVRALCAGLPNEESCIEEAAEGNPVENVLENNNDIEDLDDVEDDEPESPDTPPLCPEAVRLASQTGVGFDKWPIEVLGYDGSSVDLKIKSPLFDDETIQFYHVEYGIETSLSSNCEAFLDIDGDFETTITAKCLHGSQYAIINIFASDSAAYSIGSGDNATVPKCCHTPEASGVATAQYSFIVACKDVCEEDVEED